MHKNIFTIFTHSFTDDVNEMKYLAFILVTLLISCNKDTSQEEREDIDIGIGIFVEDINGNNLLTDTSSNAIKVDAIRLTYLINGHLLPVYNKNLDCPYSVCYIADPGNERIGLTPNYTESELYPITYIDWGNGDTDTIKCHFHRVQDKYSSSISCEIVWFNDTRMYPDSAMLSYGRTFRIIK